MIYILKSSNINGFYFKGISLSFFNSSSGYGYLGNIGFSINKQKYLKKDKRILFMLILSNKE